MPQLVIPSLSSKDRHFVLEGSDAHHAIRVLRLKVGDSIILTNGEGLRFKARLTFVDADIPEGRGDIIDVFSLPVKKAHLHIFQGLPRGAKFDFVIEKAVELGVASLTPFLSEKNPIHLSSDEAVRKRRRWVSVAESALKQSGSSQLMVIHPLISFDEMMLKLQNKTAFVLERSCHHAKPIDSLKGNFPHNEVFIVVGPESGFTNKEKDMFESSKIPAVSLGDRVLRTETAGLVMASILNYEFGNFS